MPVARYFLFVGGALLALLLGIDALVPPQVAVASNTASAEQVARARDFVEQAGVFDEFKALRLRGGARIGADDVLAALLHIVVGTDGHRLDLLLGADDVFERGTELKCEPTVGNED